MNKKLIDHLSEKSKRIAFFFFFLIFTSYYVYAQQFPSGNYTVTAKVDEIGTGNPIEMKFNFYFEKEKVSMRLDTNVASEAYCEGQYAVMKNKNGIYRLKYKGEGICSDDGDINIFYIKKSKNDYYIKSGRFDKNNWQKLKKL